MIKKLLVIICAITLLVFAGKFGLEYQYKKKFDQFIQLAAPFATISYKNISIDMQGGVNLSNLNITQVGDDEYASIKNIRVFSSNRTFLYKGFDILKDNTLPDVFSISIDRFEADARLGQQFNDKKECLHIEEPLNISNFTDPRIVSDISINLKNDDGNFLKATLIGHTDGISTTSAKIIFDKSLIETKNVSLRNLPLKSAEIENSYDQSYATNAIQYCAKKLSLSPEQYLNTVVGSDSFYNILSVVPSPEVKTAIQTQISGKNSLKFIVTPSESAKNFEQLMLFKPEQIIRALNLKVEENGNRITTLLGTPTEVIEQNQTILSPEPLATVSTLIPKKTTRYLGQRKFQFKEINKADAKNHIGKIANIYRKNRLITGEILEVKKNKIKINNRRQNGSSIMSLSLFGISKIEVKIYENRSE
jgi:hypothetical protein